jgi:hypothetical protein
METLNDSTIANFAAAVRAELADLPKREIAELTDGLEVGLQDRLNEEGADFEPGSPATYAQELREAAGVAPKALSRKHFSVAALNEGFTEWMTRTAFGRTIFDFTVSLRPVWWVLRAIVAYIITDTLSRSHFSLWFLPLLVLISVQWGRKQWLTQKFFTAILLPLNLLAIFLSVPSYFIIADKVQSYYSMESFLGELPAIDGLRLNGVPVTDIRSFDKSGAEVTGLTFQDETGNALLSSEGTPGAMQVPDLRGMPISEVPLALTNMGINNVEFNRIDNGLDSEVVVQKTAPGAGYWIDPKSTLTVTVGKPSTIAHHVQ